MRGSRRAGRPHPPCVTLNMAPLHTQNGDQRQRAAFREHFWGGAELRSAKMAAAAVGVSLRRAVPARLLGAGLRPVRGLEAVRGVGGQGIDGRRSEGRDTGRMSGGCRRVWGRWGQGEPEGPGRGWGAGGTTTGCSVGREEVSEELGEGGSGGRGLCEGHWRGSRGEEEWGRGLGTV